LVGLVELAEAGVGVGISVGPSQFTPARPTQLGLPRPSICQCRDPGLQRRRIDRARDPHPSPGRKLDLDRPAAAGRRDWTRQRPNSATTTAGTKPGLIGGILRLGAKRQSLSQQQ